MRNKKYVLIEVLLLLLIQGFICSCGPASVDYLFSSKGVECADVDEAEKISGINFAVESIFEGMSIASVYAVKGKAIQINYGNDGGDMILRKVKSRNVIIDNTPYQNLLSVTFFDVPVTVKSRSGKVYAVTWKQKKCSYSLLFPQGKDNNTALAISQNCIFSEAAF
ncbi:MAG TPA: hypothetical protein DCM57_08695 [Treponema sp.]|nr:hypothetical protein [Treponema sp.]